MPEDLNFIRAPHLQMLEGTTDSFSIEKRYIRKDGSLVWARVTLSPQRDSEGRTECIIAIVEEIQARKQAEQRLSEAAEALRMSEQRYRSVFQTSLECIALSRLSDRTIIDVNDAFVDLMGYRREEVIGRNGFELNVWVNPEDRLEVEKALRGNSSFQDRTGRFRKKNGEIVWVQQSATVIEIEGESCLLGFFRDITAAKAAQEQLDAAAEALRVSEERYRAAFQTSLDAININRIDDGRFIDCNQAFLDSLGYKREEVLGRTSQELGVWADPRDREEMIEILRQNSSCRGMEAQFRKKNGEVIWGEISASQIRDRRRSLRTYHHPRSLRGQGGGKYHSQPCLLRPADRPAQPPYAAGAAAPALARRPAAARRRCCWSIWITSKP